MNKYGKIGLTALAGSLVAGSVSAATLSVSGGASLTYSGGDDKAVTGNGWTMGDSVTFSASGDVNDIGVTLSIELDGDAASAKTNSGTEYDSTTSMNVVDSHSISFDFGDAGSLTFAGHGGDGAMSAKDDVMPNAYEEAWDVVAGADAGIIKIKAAAAAANAAVPNNTLLFPIAVNPPANDCKDTNNFGPLIISISLAPTTPGIIATKPKLAGIRLRAP